MILFVYGSLRKGQYNHVRYGGMDMRRLVFLGTGKTVPEFTLVSFGSYPGLYAGGNTGVTGELYEIDPEHDIAKRIEIMEVGAGYKRVEVKLVDGRVVNAYVQSGRIDSYSKPVPSGDWSDVMKPNKKDMARRAEGEMEYDHECAIQENKDRSKPKRKVKCKSN